MRPGFDEWALGLALAVSKRSRDPSTKVGAVIIRPDKTIASMGYNGFPRNMEDKEEWWETKEEKYARVIHAEMNALLNCKESVTRMTLYITHPPCENCAKHVAASGISRVVFRVNEDINKRWNTKKSEEIFANCQVMFQEVLLEE